MLRIYYFLTMMFFMVKVLAKNELNSTIKYRGSHTYNIFCEEIKKKNLSFK